MTDVTVIGLGAMGSALADALLKADHNVTVWNRTPARAERYRTSNAGCATSIAEAVANGKTIMVCISDYAATTALFDDTVQPLLANRTIIQFSTGTPKEARDAEQWANSFDADYLDGAILAYPAEIGDAALIAVSGNRDNWNQQRELLGALSRDIRYLGVSIGAAAGLDVAVLTYYVCAHLGLVHGALVCESEAVSPALLADVIADSLPSDTEELRKLGTALKTGEFANADASIAVYNGVIDRIMSHARASGINSEIPAFADRIYKKGLVAGFGDEEVVSLVKVLRSS